MLDLRKKRKNTSTNLKKILDLPPLLPLSPHPVDQSVEEHLNPGNHLDQYDYNLNLNLILNPGNDLKECNHSHNHKHNQT